MAQSALLALPDELTYVDGALVACGIGTAYQSILRMAVSGRDRVLVVGLGRLGAVMLAVASGAEVIDVDLQPDRLRLAVEVGAAHVLPANADPTAALHDLTDGHGVEVALDCSGSDAGRQLCLAAVRQWGRVAFVGEGGTVTFAPSPLLVHKQLTLVGSWVCGLVEMEQVIELLARKRLHPEVTVTHRFPLTEADVAYHLFDSGGTGKVVLTWD